VQTPRGQARAHVVGVPGARGALILGHGAGGGVGASDLQAAAEGARSKQLEVVLVEQPYRVAGRRAPAPAAQLDEAWLTAVAWLRERELAEAPLVFGGRSMGARVACRTAAAGGARGVICLAFPLLPPRRASTRKPAASRLAELDAVDVPTLVIQGMRDPFGMPPPGRSREVIPVDGDHSLRSDLTAVREAVARWLGGLAEDWR